MPGGDPDRRAAMSPSDSSAAAGAVADYVAKIEAELRARSGPRGWSYEFAKLFAIARKPV